MDVGGCRALLAAYFEPQASWRADRAARYPGDERNRRAADGLREFVLYVRMLPDDDDRLERLAAMGAAFAGEWFSVGKELSRELSRYRFDDPTESCDELMDMLPELVLFDLLEAAKAEGVLGEEGIE